MITECAWFGYDGEAKKWVSQYTNPNLSSHFEQPTKLKFITLNVLYKPNPLFDLLCQSNKRYSHQFHLLSQSQADIITLNEVLPEYYQLLQQQPWVQQHYYLSELLLNTTHMGNIILTKVPFLAAYSHSFSKEAKCPRNVSLGLLGNKHFSLLVGSVHITAYEGYYESRQKQLTELLQAIQGHPQLSPVKSRVFLGDFNLHYPFEDQYLEDLGLVDLWRETNEEREYGYTYDAMRNRLVWSIFCWQETRRMRLDRIVCAKGGELIPVGKVELFADRGVPGSLYLYCSDHFGLEVTMRVQSLPYVGSKGGLVNRSKKIARNYFVHYINLGLRYGLLVLLYERICEG